MLWAEEAHPTWSFGDSLRELPQAIGFALDYAGVIGAGIGGAKKDSIRKRGHWLKWQTVAVLSQESKEGLSTECQPAGLHPGAPHQLRGADPTTLTAPWLGQTRLNRMDLPLGNSWIRYALLNSPDGTLFTKLNRGQVA